MKEQLEVLEKKNMRLRKKLEQKPTSLKKLEKLLKERMDDMNEELGEIQLLKGKYGRVRNCVNMDVLKMCHVVLKAVTCKSGRTTPKLLIPGVQSPFLHILKK